MAPTPWVHEEHPDLRKVTLVVRVTPPPELAGVYRQLAARYRRLEPMMRAAAEGGFGSGFAMVRRRGDTEKGEPESFIVTNRHVVDLSSRATVLVGGSDQKFEAEVAYVDPTYDLAVLTPAVAGATGWPSSGLDVAIEPAKDQQPVVASGYPGLGNAPSYQVTRGYVSNERFLLDDGTGERLYVQHTAPIDPGSSGGPLTREDGKLIGVNTLKAIRRENVALAIPALAVAAAVQNASSAHEEPLAVETARAACVDLIRELGRGAKGIGVAERAISASLAAHEGLASIGYLPDRDKEWVVAFLNDPTRVIVHALALRLVATVPADSSAARDDTCVLAPDVGSGTFAFTVATKRGPKVWTFARDQGRFKIVAGELEAPKGELLTETPHGAKKWTPSLR